MRQDSYIAANRFGLGVRPDEVSYVEANPKNWLLAQIQGPETNTAYFNDLNLTRDIIIYHRDMNMKAKAQDDKSFEKDARKTLNETHQKEMIAKTLHAATTNTPFYERLVDFWANHFTVSVKKGEAMGLAASFEREAIRPHITGNFADMLIAVESHPAMLIYLDNYQSIGPNSQAGAKQKKGLNENLAREIMELHTLGVDGGYTQTDVTSFAKVITGWTIGNDKTGNRGEFIFMPQRHEPGAQTVMGRSYADDGVKQGVGVLMDFAHHSATAKHLATQLARHFIADEPPPQAVATLAQVFTQTGGNLTAVYRALIDLPEAWSLANAKIKSSYDLVVSAIRLCGIPADVPPAWYLQSLQFLGDAPMTANSPAGFSDKARDIAGPESILRRIEWAQGAAHKLKPSMHYQTLASLAIGPIMSAPMGRLLSSTTNDTEGLALLLGSPEFQRR